ncbi:hypothetical protein D1F64_07540 [Breoghania sp. L-A4]|nr:hypothetical protein D1F64_07540 [Breoghania sp. L-A4]
MVPARAEPYTLSERTASEFRVFKEIQGDMADMQALANVLVAIAPFRSLLDGAGITDPFEITAEPWDVFGTAVQGLSSHYRQQLRTFCELEALKQHKSKDDFRFWRNLSKTFHPKKTAVDLSGRWRKRITPQHRGLVPTLQFEANGNGYTGYFVVTLDGEDIRRPLNVINVSGSSVSFSMANGSDKITFLLRAESDRKVLTGRVSNERDKAEISFDKL